MIVNALEIAPGTSIPCDICIIGAGIAGIAIARELNAAKLTVTLIESGGFVPEDSVQELYRGEVVNRYPRIGNSYLFQGRLRYFGGSSNHWGGQSRPFEEHDFEQKDWIPDSGWPITKSDLRPYYQRAEQYLGLNPFLDGPYSSLKRNTPAHFSDESGSVVTRPFQSRPTNFRVGRVYRAEIERSENVRLFLNSTVVNLKLSAESSTVSAVEVLNSAAKKIRITAKKVIVACGGIENARLLLASNNVAATGIGNQNDLVGRYFMEHPHCYNGVGLLALWKHAIPLISLALGAPSGHFASRKFIEENRTVGVCLQLSPIPTSKISPQDWSANDDVIAAWAQNFDQAPRPHKRTLFKMVVLSEQSPNRESRVTLTPERDRLNIPRVKLDWRVSDLDLSSIARFAEKFLAEVASAQLGRGKLLFEHFSDISSHLEGGYHHMGTTRMHDDPKKGVIDKNCQVHGIRNLFIAGSSAFPTSSAVNPTFTLSALAIRLADYLKTI